MRHSLAAVLAVATVGAAAATGQAPPAPAAAKPRLDIPFSTAIVTPHVPWATSLPGGPVRGFFVPPVERGRDMVELMQRLALRPTTVTIDRSWDINCWGIGDHYGHERGDKDDFRTVYGYVEEDLTGPEPFEVLVIPGLNGWSRFTRKTRDAILRRVHEGAGLVLLHPFLGDVKGHPFAGDEPEPDPRLWEISPLVSVPDDRVNERGYPEPNQDALTQGSFEKAAPHFLTEGLDLDLLPSGSRGGRFYRYEPRGTVVVQANDLPVIATRTYGKGRVVAFATEGDGFIPDALDPWKTRTYWDYWEYQYSLLARAVLWAARGDPETRIRSLSLSSGAGAEILLRASTARELEVEARARSEFGMALGTARKRVRPASSETRVAFAPGDLAPAGWPGGRSIVDVVVRDAGTGATLNWGWAATETPKEATLARLRPGAAVYREGETLSLVTMAAGALEGLKLRIRWSDDLGRVRAVEEKPTRGERTFFHRLDHVLGKRVEITGELVDSRGRVVDQLRHEPILVVSRERRRKEYRGVTTFETPPHYFAQARLRLLRERAMDTGFTWGGDVNDELHLPRGWFGVYWYDRGPTTPEGMEKVIAEYERTREFETLPYLAKKELFRRTGDKRYLVRQPSLDDPKVLARLADISRTSARNKAVYNMDYYFVGDEGSLGSYADPVDFCWGEHTLASFRKWLRAEYGSLESLNRTWGSTFTSWDAVVPLTTDEARRDGRFAPWADHRTYMEVSFANAYATVRKAVREGDPDGHIALSGTQVTTPWDGCDWHRLDGVIDDFLSYSGGNQWDIHRSFAKPGARIGFWTGYGRRGAPVRDEVFTAALQGVLFPQLFWNYSIVNPDMTFSASGRDLGTAFGALRFDGVGRLLMESERLSDPVVLHYSMPSVHAAGILGYHGPRSEKADRLFPADRDGWVKLLDDLGLGFEFLAAPQVEGGGLGGRRVFILPFSMAVSEREVAEVRRFAEAGGVVIADGATGLFDEHCAWRLAGALDDFFGIAAPLPSSRREAPPRVAGPVRVTDLGSAWGLVAEPLAGLLALEPGVRASSGRPLLRVGETDVAIVNRVGKGLTIYLNALLDRDPGRRDASASDDDEPEGDARAGWRALLRAMLAQAGVRPAVTVTGPAGRPLSRVRVARYRFGQHEVLALLNSNLDVQTSFGRDGVTVYDDASGGRVVRQEVEITLPRATHVTNVRTGEFLGMTERLEMTLTAGDLVVLALGPERPALVLEGPRAARRGEAPSFAARFGVAGKRLLRWHVFGPDGRLRPEYAQNAVVDGAEAVLVLPSALNDPAGAYRLKATDVLSGATAETILRLD